MRETLHSQMRPGKFTKSVRRCTIRIGRLNKRQEAFFRQYCGAHRFVYNWGLARLKEIAAADKDLETRTPFRETMNRLCREYTQLRHGEASWLLELNTTVTRGALRDIEQAMKNFFGRCKKGDAKPGYPRFKSKYSGQQGFYIRGGVKWLGPRRFSFAKAVGVIKLRQDIPGEPATSAMRIIHRNNKWYASFSILYEPPNVEPVPPDNLVGVDIGVKEYAVVSDGTRIPNPRWLQKSEQRLKHWQRKLSNQKKFSNRWYKTKRRIAKVHTRIANQRKHYSHLQSKMLAESYDGVAIEGHSLAKQMKSAKEKKQGTNLQRGIADVGHGHFRLCLTYKLKDRGKTLVELNPYFPSTKTCHKCQFVNETLELSDRDWTCPQCGVVHDRDLNAAKNIEREGRQQVRK